MNAGVRKLRIGGGYLCVYPLQSAVA